MLRVLHGMRAATLMLALLMLAGPWAQARPVDLSTPSNAFGPASDQGYASRWTEVSEADFGGGFSGVEDEVAGRAEDLDQQARELMCHVLGFDDVVE